MARLGGALVLGATVVALAVVPLQAPTSAAAAPSVACPNGVSQCVVLHLGSRTVAVGPTTLLQTGEFVNFSMSGFTPGGTVRLAYCPTPSAGHPVTIVADPECGFGTDPTSDVDVAPLVVPVNSDGSVEASFPVIAVAPGDGDSGIKSGPVVPPGSNSSFFCDNSPNYCALEVTDDGPGVGTDAGNPLDNSDNTVIVPLSFAGESAGCPASDPLVFTTSSYSVQQLIPAAVESTCHGPGGVVALNSPTDSERVMSNFAGGAFQLAFTDDPSDPVEQADVARLHVAYVPVAVSATVVAFLGGDLELSQTIPYPIDSLKLTPDMVSGLITSAYQAPIGSDLIVSLGSSLCAQLYNCNSTYISDFDGFDYLNPPPGGLAPPGGVPPGGIANPVSYGAFMPSTPSGASAQVTDWLCRQGNRPFDVNLYFPGTTSGARLSTHELRSDKKKKKPPPPPPVARTVSVTDDVASSTLTTPPTGNGLWPPPNNPGASWVFPSCHSYPRLPDLSSSAASYTASQSPQGQAKSIRGFAYGGGGAPGLVANQTAAAFGVMDWSQAAYYGLNSASLQNASGNFVAPSPAAVDAALDDAEPCPAHEPDCPAGTYTYDYTDTDNAGAYPMPLITYAVVPTTPLPAAQARAVKDLLDDLVGYSHSSGSVPLPGGYVPLPENLYDQAKAEIAQDVVAAPPGAAGGEGGKVAGGIGARLSVDGSGTSESGGGSGGTGPGNGAGSSSGARHVAGGHDHSLFGAVGAALVSLIGGAGHWKLVMLALAGLLALVVGPALLLFPGLRRRLPLPRRRA